MLGRRVVMLHMVKTVHTIAWAFFASCIIALPFAAWQGLFDVVGLLLICVLFEIAVLISSGWRCPLTLVAARYTADREANFDIYLPRWLARHNKTIFGWLFIAGLLFSFARWQHWL
jgi:hypothetical protein